MGGRKGDVMMVPWGLMMGWVADDDGDDADDNDSSSPNITEHANFTLGGGGSSRSSCSSISM